MSITPENPSIKAALELLDNQLSDEQQIRNIPGMSAAIVLDQEIIWSNSYGYADLDKKVPMNSDYLFRVGSITKLFTATMLMHLRDAGKLNLDDPLEKYEKRFILKSRFADPKPPTFRQVVSHTAGIPRESTINVWKELDFPQADAFLEKLEETEITFPAYTEFKYSNLGIALMGHTLSVAAGQPYREYVKQNILEPLGMTNSGFDLTDEIKSRLACGYLPSEDGKSFEQAPLFDLEGMAPAGQLYSSIKDMARFVSLQFSDKAAGGSQILGGTTLREMHAPVFLGGDEDGAIGIGIGWLLHKPIEKHNIIEHSGGVHGYTTNICLVPDMKLGIIVFTNTMSSPGEICINALDLLIPVINRLEKQAEILADRNRQAPPEWEQYVGDYEFAGQYLVIKISEGKLYLTSKEDDPAARSLLIPEKEHVFRMQGGNVSGELAVFQFDEEGRIIHLMIGGYQLDRI